MPVFRFLRVWFWLIGVCFFGLLAVLGYAEIKTSLLQSRFLSRYAATMTYALEPGANPNAAFPETGPYNQRLGYTYLPYFIKSLQSDGFDVVWQMRPSKNFGDFIRYGGFPIYHAKAGGGLTIFDRQGQAMHRAVFPTRIFNNFTDIPPLLTDTLLFIENRDLLASSAATHNPAISWGRLGAAAFGQIGALLGYPQAGSGGGSTLATQIEKFRHSPNGQTYGVRDKLRQMASASVRAYLDGPDTRKAARQIVLDYLNATPLSARPSWGEINGIGDGLWAWFGIDLADVAPALQAEENAAMLPRKADIYKHCLALILAERRPSYYLLANRAALEQLIAATLDRLTAQGVISPRLHEAVTKAPLHFLPNPPPLQQNSFIAQKASNAIRRYLLNSFGIDNLYELDRFDLTVGSTLDMGIQSQVTEFLQKLHDKDFVKEIGLTGFRLLDEDGDPTKINWSLLLFERTASGNMLRVQADNLDKPLDLNDGAKLDLGSTAKFRTLVTYLEIVADLHARYGALDAGELRDMASEAPDNLTRWVTGWLAAHEDRALEAMLADAMQRQYSANASEGFFTGGGLHYFHNFEPRDNGRTVTVAEAVRKSINLPLIRLMRDIVNYLMTQGPNPKQEILGDAEHPARRAFLERFADKEGAVYLNRFYNNYHALSPDAALAKLMRQGDKRAAPLAVLFRSVRPQATAAQFVTFVRGLRPDYPDTDTHLRKIFDEYPKDRYSLADRGYVASVHPLELWLAEYLAAHPGAARKDVVEASKQERRGTYNWLFKSSTAAQDTRIRILMEQDAFITIQQDWAKFGYPFDHLVPSLATSIGSSADRPGALAELMGIILNDGVRMPAVRANYVNFAMDTPFQTMMKRRDPHGERVLVPEIAREVKKALLSVVEDGTAKRVDGAFVDANGAKIPIGGKTGTGDHRYDEFGPGGVLLSSRVVNRTATFVFFIGDRHFGSITAYVAGPDAANYKFTSALPSQMLKALAPVLTPLINETKTP